MDTVILAAGKGSRLEGIAAPFHKPLMVVDGKALITRAVMQASSAQLQNHDHRVIVVVAPENAWPISHMVPDTGYTRMIVQPQPLGPGHALLLGLEMVKTDQVLILMADNVFGTFDISECLKAASDGSNVIGVRSLSNVESFTRLRTNGEWVEKVPASTTDFNSSGRSECWVGPLIFTTKTLEVALNRIRKPAPFETSISPAFNLIGNTEVVETQTYDIGTPEEWK